MISLSYSWPICKAIAEQAERSPDQVAVEFENDCLTYGELWDRSRRIAHWLRAGGVRPDHVVMVSLERSPDLPVALLGVLASGAAYMPLDPGSPPERLAFMLADSGARALVTHERLHSAMRGFEGPVLSLDSGLPPLGEVFDTRLDCLAYVIYTSGSTGRPKAAMNTHRGLANRLAWMQDAYPLAHGDRVLQKTPIDFDVSLWELIWPLTVGARLVIARPGGHRDPAYLVDIIQRANVTVLHFVPSMLRAFLGSPHVEQCRSIRNVICSGEALPADLAGRLFERLPGVRLHNLYGPTEAAIDVTAWECEPGNTQIRIGAPITNVRAYVVGEELELLGPGRAGELMIGGPALARGYLGQPGLTATCFLPDHISGEPGARLYRTGDRARWHDDGTLEFLGRVDDQVKIRGVRVEPGEAAAVLARHDAVSDAVVIAKPDAIGGHRLIGYAVPDPAQARPVMELLRIEGEGVPVSAMRHELPDGRTVLVPSRSEAEFLEREVFDEERYAALGVDPSPGGCVLDCGAHAGIFTLYASRSGATVYAFEPIPPLFELLRMNIAIHGIDARLFPCALADAEGEETLTHYPNLSIMSGRHADPGEDREVMRAFLGNGPDLDRLMDWGLQQRRYVRPVRRLSAVLRETGIDRVDLLKIDVEKSEEEVIAGVDESDWAKIHQVLVEVHDRMGRLSRLTAKFEDLGYQVRAEADPQLAGTGLVMLAAVRRGGAVARRAIQHPPARWASPVRLVADLRRHAQRSLPEAMVPSAFVLVKEFPVTVNGKLDRRALPDSAPELGLTSTWTAPDGEIQVRLAALWAELLGHDKPGADDDFFELGGHSLMANQLVARVRAALGVELPLDAVFTGRTIRRIADEITIAAPTSHVMPGLRRVDRDGILPLSFAQERLWYLQELHPGIRAYQFQAVIGFTGALDADALAMALTEIVRRHEAYRTTFAEGPDGPQQLIHPPFSPEVPIHDLSGEQDPEAAARNLIECVVAAEIVVDRLPLVRWELLRTAADRHLLLHLEHHLIHDGWAFNVFVGELLALYKAYAAGEPSPLPEPELQFADFAAWQRGWPDRPAADQQVAYWRSALEGVPPRLELPTDRPRTAARRFLGAAPRYVLPAQTCARIGDLARDAHITVFTAMLAVFEVLLCHWSGQNDFCVGSGIANRRWQQTEQLIGMVINTVALRADLRGDPAIREVLARAHTVVVGANANQDIPFHRVVAAVNPERVPGWQPLWQVMFAFHDAPMSTVTVPGLQVDVTPGIANGSAKFDLNVIAVPRAKQWQSRARWPASGEIELIWEYDQDLFDAATIAAAATRYRQLLDAVAARPEARVSELLKEVP